MRRSLAEAALRVAAAAAAVASSSRSSSSKSLRGAIVLSPSPSSSASIFDAAIFARASSSAAASSSVSVASAAEGDSQRSSSRGGKSGEKPARQPRRRNVGTSGGSGGSGGGRTSRGRDNSAGYDDGFPGSDSAVSYDKYGDAVPAVVVNHAGEGAPGWQLLGEEPEISATYWALDAAGGRAGGAPEFAALLSSDAKDAMWAAYKGNRLSTSAIAKLFGIREQRAAAILALRAMEEEMDSKISNSNEEVALLFEGGIDGSGTVRAALDAAAARIKLIERRRLEGIGQAPKAAEDTEGAKNEEENQEQEPAAEALADEADAAVSAELSADAAAGAAFRDVSLPFSSSAKAPLSPSSSKSGLAAGSVVEVVQGIWPCDRLRGGGERAVAPLPRYPAFELLMEHEGNGNKKGSRSSSRKANRNSSSHNSHNDEETPAESGVHAAERAIALKAEAEAVREFKARLAFNVGSPAAARAVLGVRDDDDSSSASIVTAPRSVSRAAVAPRRPEGGWPLLVKPLSSVKGRPAREKPFVALPDGTRRPLSAEERAAFKRATPLPRKRGVVS